ncbi:selenoprotein W-like [Convolutriloba macropyga]|uniref:selenoprotein W-like n=1 Tax=Convolutriloba macropyga TaxID=536237 RepID=UPI003F528835
MRLFKEIKNEFASYPIEFTSEGTPNVTGLFEVKVNEMLVHSKRNGDGYVDNERKLQKIFKAVEEALGL